MHITCLFFTQLPTIFGNYTQLSTFNSKSISLCIFATLRLYVFKNRNQNIEQHHKWYRCESQENECCDSKYRQDINVYVFLEFQIFNFQREERYFTHHQITEYTNYRHEEINIRHIACHESESFVLQGKWQ